MLRTLIEGTRACEDPDDDIAPRPPGFISEMLSQAGAPGILVVACTVAAVALAFIIPGKDAYLALDLARFAGMLCFMLINFAALVFFWFRRHDQVYLRSIVIPAAGFLSSLWVWINIEPASFNYGIIFALAGVIVIAASHIFSRLVFGTEPDILEDEDAL
jgi:amino acid transporter